MARCLIFLGACGNLPHPPALGCRKPPKNQTTRHQSLRRPCNSQQPSDHKTVTRHRPTSLPTLPRWPSNHDAAEANGHNPPSLVGHKSKSHQIKAREGWRAEGKPHGRKATYAGLAPVGERYRPLADGLFRLARCVSYRVPTDMAKNNDICD